MDITKAHTLINQLWQDSIIPALCRYIRIPNKSPLFDPSWRSHGYMYKAVVLIEGWCKMQPIDGMHVEVIHIEDRTPLLFIDIPGQRDECVLIYGHLDKQPEMEGWRDNLGPWKPVIENDRLYGRGSADDGYAVFAALAAIRVLKDQRIPHARCVIIIETCEESGSGDLPIYLEALSRRIDTPSLVICLDSGAGNYEQLWCTTSLRGMVGGTLSVDVLTEGVHSGDASGVVPSSFRIIRQLLGRLEDASTGALLPAMFYDKIPNQRREQAMQAAEILGKEVYRRFPLINSLQPVASDVTELILNRTWRPALCVTGAAGLPALEDGGNVLRPKTAVKLSLRLPPTCDAVQSAGFLKVLLEKIHPTELRCNLNPNFMRVAGMLLR